MSVPAAGVEHSGLLGMALAFRAAAGEVGMPNRDDNASAYRQWERIDADSPNTAEERCRNLRRRIRSLEDALASMDRDDALRDVLIRRAHRDRKEREIRLERAEREARRMFRWQKQQATKFYIRHHIILIYSRSSSSGQM